MLASSRTVVLHWCKAQEMLQHFISNLPSEPEQLSDLTGQSEGMGGDVMHCGISKPCENSPQGTPAWTKGPGLV